MIILFDKNMNAVDFGYLPISSSANLSHELLQVQVNVEKQGYLFIYTSNESNSEDPVYFDDLKVTLHPGKVDAAYDYYPFGLPTAESWERVTAPVVDRKYQGPYAYWEKETDLHRFKARMYDGQIGRWLSTDPANQYNSPYLGMGNRPMKGVDRDGRFFFDRMVFGGVRGLFNGDGVTNGGFKYFSNAMDIRAGLFEGTTKQVISRFTWESGQTALGLVAADGNNKLDRIEGIVYFDGATVIEGGGMGGSVSLGSYIMLSDDEDVGSGEYTFMHEYGHYLQSQRSGPLYMIKYGIPSGIFGKSWTEHDANFRAAEYFKDNYDFEWDSNFYAQGSSQHKYSFLPSNEVDAKWWEFGLFFTGHGNPWISLLNSKGGGN
jgi:RHS repeat-associated protein